MTWLQTVCSWVAGRRPQRRKQEELADEISNLTKEAAFEQLKADTATVKAEVIRVSSRGEEMAAQHQEQVARAAAGRRARLEAEAEVLRREYASRE